MKTKGLFLFIFLILIFLCGFVGLVLGDFTEDLVVELDKSEVYPSQDVTVTVYYRITFPEGESYDIGSNVIDMEITTSGLVDVIETNDYLLFPLIGSPAESGRLYEASVVEFRVPDDHGDYGVEERTYDVTIDNLRDYSNMVSLRVLAVKEDLFIELDKGRADPGDSVVVTVKYRLDAPSDVVLSRPLSFLNIDLGGLKEEIVPPLNFPVVVRGGEQITIATYELEVPEDAAIRSYDFTAFAGPPGLESDPVTLDLGDSGDSGIVPLFTRWDLWVGITVLGGSAIGGGYIIRKIRSKKKIPVKSAKQLLVSNPIEGKGWRIVDLNPDRSVKEGPERTLSDEEVEQIRRVTRVIDGSEYDDLEFTDPKTGETITWRGPDEIPTSPPPVVPKPAVIPKSGKPVKKKKTIKKPIVLKPKKKPKPPPPPAIATAVSPSVLSQQPPKPKPKLQKWGQKLQSGVDMVNKGVKGDKRIQKILENYKGRRYVIDVTGEGSYGIDVSSDGLVLRRNVVARSSDGYIQMNEQEMTGIFDRLKGYQEYQRYKDHPHVVREIPPEVTKKHVIKELGGIVGKKLTQSLLYKKKPISGIGLEDVSMLKDIFIPPKGSPSK
jgi:hypothetical protein